MRSNYKFRAGQSIVELMVAIAVGVILITGAVAVIGPTIKTQGDTTRLQISAGLGRELLGNATVMAESNWHNLDALATSSASKYYLIASTSPFVVASGTESVLVATTTYNRYFYLDDVYRNDSLKIDEAGTFYDPSTKKITVVYGWGTVTNSITSYLTRTGNNVFAQTDWSLGPNQTGIVSVTTTNRGFSSSTGINYATSSASTSSLTGSIVIQGL